MADVTLRTKYLESKYRFAFFVRVFTFFAIPTLYFVYAFYSTSDNGADATTYYDIVPSRHLLGLADTTRNCTPPAILEFPPDGLTRTLRKNGFIAIHCLLAIYCFLLLGTVCEQYFVPAIGFICQRLEMSADVAGATFMATASSSPELFINCVGTFVTEGDLGVGAVVGSAVFNVLAVPAFCSLMASKAVELDWWSVSRDCLMYAAAVVALILTLLDDRVYWQEALMLVLMYGFYILAMVFNSSLGNFMRSSCCVPKKKKLYTEITPLLTKDKSRSQDTHKLNGHSFYPDLENGDFEMLLKADTQMLNNNNNIITESFHNLESSISSVWSWPGEDSSTFRKFFWVLTWPNSLLLWATIPDCRIHRRLYPLTFIMCITWIGGVSYLVAWIITVLGDTLNVPDSITGLTVLAAGTSLPEAVSSVLVTMQGHGAMGLSNSIGSNTFDILLCLGLPWLIKALFYPVVPGNHWVLINSSGLSYSAISLLSTLFALYFSLMLNSFRLDWRIGLTCTIFYIGFLIMACLIELNVLFPVNLPICPH